MESQERAVQDHPQCRGIEAQDARPPVQPELQEEVEVKDAPEPAELSSMEEASREEEEEGESLAQRQAHWNAVYATKGDASVSWFEEAPAFSLSLIQKATQARGSAIDVGGGASRLPDALLELGFARVTGLDLSAEAQRIARDRLNHKAGGGDGKMNWIVADVSRWSPDELYDVWHDRAAFHFLLEPGDQARYAAALHKALAPGGVAVIGTFAPDGPERCSGLPIVRHDGASLSAILGPGLRLVSEERYEHCTPAGSIQRFQFSTFRRD